MSDRWPHYRQSVRLPAYDYAGAGGYFITLVAHERQCLFGEVIDHDMRLSKYGEIVQEEWLRSAELRPGVMLDAWVVMPDHVHGVIIFPMSGEAGRDVDKTRGQRNRNPRSLSSFVAGFKAAVTTRINTLRQLAGVPVWQRNYYEHVIRNDTDLDRIREYVVNNPARWEEDSENPQGRGAR